VEKLCEMDCARWSASVLCEHVMHAALGSGVGYLAEGGDRGSKYTAARLTGVGSRTVNMR